MANLFNYSILAGIYEEIIYETFSKSSEKQNSLNLVRV